MNEIDNPYTPGAGIPPHELAGRDDILNTAQLAIRRTKKGNFAKSQLLLGLRGVGKTVLLNRINLEALIMALHKISLRDELIKKGIAYSPEFGTTTFSVPKFDEYLRRAEKFNSA